MNADKRRFRPNSSLSASIRVHLRFILLSVVISGCGWDKHGPTTRPASMRDRQEAALQDPFGYSPSPETDISGGKINELDRGAMRKDIDHVLNP